ncbi:hypothetical protein [Streptomyces sp. NPDC050121]|uniref:hypothetical protein n=1 Tax=Streptomyces sp. NPDC050121 TaxID=3365601 RepID=UPI0037A73A08
MTKNQPAEGVLLPGPSPAIEVDHQSHRAGLIRRRRNQLGTRWRKLTPGAQAVVVLAVLRHDQRLVDMAGGNHISASAVRRCVKETIELLAVRAPRLDRALKKIARSGGVVVLLDGTLIRTGHCAGTDNRKNFSRKHKAHGLLSPALTEEKGNLIWISPAKPGRSSEITAARHNKITSHLCRAPAPPHRRGEGSESPAQPRTCRRRARLREPEVLALPDQDPHERPARHHPPAGPVRPRKHRNPPVTDDLPKKIAPPEDGYVSSSSTSRPCHVRYFGVLLLANGGH